MKIFVKLFLIAISVLMLSACATTNQNLTQDKRTKIALIKYEMARNIIVHKDYKNLANAFKYLEEAKKTLKNDPRIYYLYAIAYQLRGNLKEYEFYLKKTISIDKNFFDAYNALGIYYASINQYKKALDMFTRLIKNPLYPNADTAFYNRALVYLKLNKVSLALDDLKNAIIFSNFTNPLYFKALINLEIKNKMYLRALEDLSSMEEHIGPSCYTRLNKAYCYIKIDEPNQAIYELNKIKHASDACLSKKNKLLKEIKNDNNTDN